MNTATTRVLCLAGVILALAAPMTIRAQGAAAAPGQLSLADALKLAEQRSEALKIAEAGLSRAQGQRYQARSQLMPQLNGTAAYQRTIESQFQAISKKSAPAPSSSGADTSKNTGADLTNS